MMREFAPEIECGIVARDPASGGPVYGPIRELTEAEADAWHGQWCTSAPPLRWEGLTDQERKVARRVGVSDAEYLAARPCRS